MSKKNKLNYLQCRFKAVTWRIRMGLFGKKKKKKQSGIYDISDMDMQEILADDEVNDKMFDNISRTQYVNTQCEQIVESNSYIEEAKKEYASVTEHLNDIQILDELEEEPRRLISETAQDMFSLNFERVESRSKKKRLPNSKYAYYSAHEDELPDALKKMQNDEQYCQMVRKDLSMLEGEKLGLREDIENCMNRQHNVKNISIIGMAAIVVIFIYMAVSGKIIPDGDNYVLTVLLFVMTVFIVMMFVLNRNAVYTLKLSEKKLNRAIVLQNKVKIKYINTVNSIEYQYAKYGVKNAYEFSNAYTMFLEDKKERERYARTTGMLGRATDQLTVILAGLGMRDAEIWQNQLEALFNPKEMVEVRHNLNVRRQKLREQIEYNINKIDEAKRNIAEYAKENPQYADEIMEIVNSYGCADV